jgi:adenylate cyclase
MHKNLSQRLLIGAAIGFIAAVLILSFTYGFQRDLFDAFEAKSLDWRYLKRIKLLWERRQGAEIEDIIIVDIDNRSLEKLGRFSQWPRTYHSQIIDYITEGGAKAIGFDVLFMEPDQIAENDSAFIRSTAQSGIVYHAMAFSMANPDAFLYPMKAPPEGLNADRLSLVLPDNTAQIFKKADRMDGKLLSLYNAAHGIGFANFSPDNDSVIRTMPLFLNFAGRQYLALSIAMVMGAMGATPDDIQVIPRSEVIVQPKDKPALHIPINDKGRVLLNYQGTFQTFRYLSYYDVLMQRIPQELFRGKYVLVGTSAAGLSDIRPVPFQDDFPGVEIHANVIYNLLTGEYIKTQKPIFGALLVALLAISIAMLAMAFRPWLSGLLGILLLGGLAYLSLVWFARHAFWFELIRPTLAILFSFMFVFIYRYVDEERNKRYIKNMFQHYLTANVVDELLKRPELLKLGGERRMATAFFSDIKDFTSTSEKLEPEELVAQLNEYLSAMTEVVLKYKGYLDKYEGDAIMAVFGVPVDQSDHASRGCLAALDMQERLQQLRQKWQQEGKPLFHARMGLNSGPMIAGNIGGEDRYDYTVIGDSVNLASRLEGANKQYGTSIMISEFTRELLDSSYVTRELDLIRVKGKQKPVRVFELVARDRSGVSNAQLLALPEYEKGLAAYRQRRWDDAMAAFKRALAADVQEGPSKTYIQRCEFYKENPIPMDWDGVFEMKTK